MSTKKRLYSPPDDPDYSGGFLAGFTRGLIAGFVGGLIGGLIALWIRGYFK